MRGQVGSTVPWILTLGISAFCVWALLYHSLESAADLGTLLAGAASALALVWLVAGYYQQGRELRLQRRELELQRETLALQWEEMSKTTKHSALSEIATILRRAREEVREAGVPGVTSSSQLGTALMGRAPEHFKLMETMPKSPEFLKSTAAWLHIEGAISRYLASLESAARLYATVDDCIALKDCETPEDFVYVNQPWLRLIPHLNQELVYAGPLAEQFGLITPGRDIARLRGFEMFQAAFPNAIREDKLAELRKRIEERERRRRGGGDESPPPSR